MLTNPDPSLINDDLAPTPLEGRTWRVHHMASLWIGMVVCVPTYMLAGGLIDLGMNWWQAVCTVLLREGVASLPLANRTVARAEALLGDLATGGVQVEAISLEPDSLKLTLATKNPMALIVNCTLLGMLHGPNEEASPIPG